MHQQDGSFFLSRVVDRCRSFEDLPVVVASFLQDLFDFETVTDLVFAIGGHSLRKVRQISDEARS